MNDPMNTHGAFSWSELATANVDGAKSFYTELLGWETDEMPMPDGGIYQMMKVGGQPVCGIMKLPSNAPKGAPPMWTSYITVDNVEATIKKAEKMGAKSITPLMDVPEVGKFCHLQDPQGAVFAVITYSKK